jgi:hypothetical protein
MVSPTFLLLWRRTFSFTDDILYNQLEKYPSEVIPIFDIAVMDLLAEKVLLFVFNTIYFVNHVDSSLGS